MPADFRITMPDIDMSEMPESPCEDYAEQIRAKMYRQLEEQLLKITERGINPAIFESDIWLMKRRVQIQKITRVGQKYKAWAESLNNPARRKSQPGKYEPRWHEMDADEIINMAASMRGMKRPEMVRAMQALRNKAAQESADDIYADMYY